MSETAENDLLGIVRYISAQLSAPVTALKMMKTMEDALAGLVHFPHKCPVVADERLARTGYRKLMIKNYIAFFTIDEKTETVNIERILYARRSWRNII